MISNFNKAYAITPLVDDMIENIDQSRVRYTKCLVITAVIHILVGILVLGLSLWLKEYHNVVLCVINIVIPLLCVDRYFTMNREIMSIYKKARESIYGEDYENAYLNEERMFISYGDLRDRYRLIEERYMNDIYVTAISLFIEISVFTLNILYF